MAQTSMDASFVGGTIYVPRIFWGQAWFDANCVSGEENKCDKYTIKKFKPATKRGHQDVAACYTFDAGKERKDQGYHVTLVDIQKYEHNGMKVGVCFYFSVCCVHGYCYIYATYTPYKHT